MSLFVIAYDLKAKKKEKRDYGPIEKALEALDSCHTQKSLWYVSYEGTAKELRKLLSASLEKRDWIVAIEFSKLPSWNKALPGTNDWMAKHFPQKSKSSRQSSGASSGSDHP